MKNEAKNKEEIDIKEDCKKIVKEIPTGFNIFEVSIIIGITLVFGVLIGCVINFDGKVVPNNANNVSNDLKELVMTYNNIVNTYYEDLNKKELMDAAIKGMVEYLEDPYSDYMDVEESNRFNELVEGSYEGIGCEISMTKDYIPIITKVNENGPAFVSGLKVGDIIVEVEKEAITNMSADNLSKLVRGIKGTTVNMKVKRLDKIEELAIKRDNIDIESVSSDIFIKNDMKIGYLKINIFASNTHKQFKERLKELESKKIDKLIIDVRNNGGGYLTTVSEILSMFMDKSQVLYQLDTKGNKQKIYAFTKEKRNIEVAILINEASASASEILASAFKENYSAKIIGVNSYGKGTVQKAFNLNGGSSIKYTIQKWLTPKGNWIDKKGVEPTIKVEMNLDYQINPSNESDNQLQTAITELSK